MLVTFYNWSEVTQTGGQILIPRVSTWDPCSSGRCHSRSVFPESAPPTTIMEQNTAPLAMLVRKLVMLMEIVMGKSTIRFFNKGGGGENTNPDLIRTTLQCLGNAHAW